MGVRIVPCLLMTEEYRRPEWRDGPDDIRPSDSGESFFPILHLGVGDHFRIANDPAIFVYMGQVVPIGGDGYCKARCMKASVFSEAGTIYRLEYEDEVIVSDTLRRVRSNWITNWKDNANWKEEGF